MSQYLYLQRPIYIMSTYKEIVYMCLDEIKLASDDAYFTQDHIIFLADKYRALLLKKNYLDLKKTIPESNYQTICLTLEPVQSIEGDECSDSYLRSIEKVPNTLPLGTPKITASDYFGGYLTYVNRERFKYVGHNKYLKNFIYCALGPDNKLYLKSSNHQATYLERVVFTGIFENSDEATEMACDEDGNVTNCDPMDAKFPLEDALIPLLIELIVKELVGAEYRPQDEQNNAKDDISTTIANNNRDARRYNNRY